MNMKKAIPMVAALIVVFSLLLFQPVPSSASDNATDNVTNNVTVNVTVEQNVNVNSTPPSPTVTPPPAPPPPPPPPPPAPIYYYHPQPPPTTVYYYIEYPVPYQYYISPAVVQPPVQPNLDPPPIINSFSVNQSFIKGGQSVTLMWTVSDILERDIDVVITPGIGSVDTSGSITLTPYETTTYTLTATNVDGDTSASITITVDTEITAAAPIIDTETTGGDAAAGGSEPADNAWLRYALLIGLLTIAVVAIIILAARKTSRRDKISGMETQSWSGTATEIKMPKTTPAAGAKLVTDDGACVPIAETTGLGRRDFRAMVTPGKADMISRQHIRLEYNNDSYYIEDSNSTNGTTVNGTAITGKGKHLLHYDDIIDLAGVLTLKFKV